MSLPNQMYTHELNGVKGFFEGQPWVVDKAADLASGTVYNGGIVSMNTSGKFVPAVSGSNTNFPMVFFVYNNSTDFDVIGDDFNIVGAPTSGTSNVARMAGVACSFAAEIETTEFKSGTYQPGDLLVPGTSSDLGKVAKYVSGACTLIGVVSNGVNSDGTLTSEHSSSVKLLRLYTIFVPKFS
jgi:hypothetical protein